MRWLVVLLLVAFCLSAGAGTAMAGPEDDRRAAEKLSDEGIQFAKQKKYALAVEKFEAALKLYPHPVIMHNLGRAHEELGNIRRAYEFFSQALQQDYSFATDGRERLNRIGATLSKTHARIVVRVTPSQSKVVVTMPDGVSETHVLAPFTLWVKAGDTAFNISNPSFKGLQETRTFKAGEEREVEFVLTPLPRLGFLRVSVNVPGADVTLSGKPLGKTPLPSTTVEAGAYQLEITAPGYAPYLGAVTVEKDAVTEVTVALEPQDGVLKPIPKDTKGTPAAVAWTLIGSGLAVAGGGVGVFMHGVSKADEVGKRYPLDPGNPGTQELQRQKFEAAVDRVVVPLNIGANVMMGVGGAAILTGIILLIADPEEDATAESTSAPRFHPLIGAMPGGAHFGGAWRF
jgi:hypothetical protein